MKRDRRERTHCRGCGRWVKEMPGAPGVCPRCDANLYPAPWAQVFRPQPTKRAPDTMPKALFLAVINSLHLHPRWEHVSNADINGGPNFVRVPHTEECPLCKRRLATGVYKVELKSGKTDWYLSCTHCAGARLPQLRDFSGMVVTETVGLAMTIECVGADAWRLEGL